MIYGNVNMKKLPAQRLLLLTKERIMFPVSDQFAAAARSHLESQLAVLTEMTAKTVESVERFFELNMATIKVSLEDNTVAAQKLIAAKSPQELIAFSAEQAQPAIAYGRQLAGIAASAHVEFARAAEEQLSASGRRFSEMVEEVSRNAPVGSENIFGMLKSAMGTRMPVASSSPKAPSK
jgi:phasin family protein